MTDEFLERNKSVNLHTKGKFKNSEEKKKFLLNLQEERLIKKPIIKQ